MKTEHDRRAFLKCVPGVGALAVLGSSNHTFGADGPTASSKSTPDGFPHQDPALVLEVVGKSHFDYEAVKSLVERQPELAKAAWDWGFGDWETALGAASHTGRRNIAEMLIANGARPDLFTFAMLGNLDVVRAFVEAHPGIQRIPGPHSITLLEHARAGGEGAAPVVEYLEALGDADLRPTNMPLDEAERAAHTGAYSYGTGAAEQFEIVDRRGQLGLVPGDGPYRAIYNQGDGRFVMTGAVSTSVQFEYADGLATAATIAFAGYRIRGVRAS